MQPGSGGRTRLLPDVPWSGLAGELHMLPSMPPEGHIKIFGVDFSGARDDNNTWVAEASLEGGELTLDSCRPIRRACLTELLVDAPAPCIAAMDFPFGLPLAFAAYWLGSSTSLVDLWEITAAGGGFEGFLERRDAFVEQQGESKRVCDAYYPESYSSLHRANPNMLPMTYRGMRMLAALRKAGWAVAPMDSGNRDRAAIEVMPGATLRALGLPYRGYKKGRNRFEMRRRILDGLAKNTRVRVAGQAELLETCMTIDDALDAVVAAFTGALWLAAPDAFRLPSDEERDGANMEGWMCVPAFLTPPA